MQDLMNLFFGPLGDEYCNIFFFYTLFSLISLILVVIMTVLSVFKKKFNWNSIALIVITFITYAQNRLLYNMCISKIM